MSSLMFGYGMCGAVHHGMIPKSRRRSASNSDPQIRALAEALVPRVKRIAYRMKQRLPAHIDADDLVGAGLLGVAQAAARWDIGDPHAFVPYAIRRAVGAMLDELRKNDHLTRAERRLVSRLFQTQQRLANSLGRQPESDEIERESGMTSRQVEDARSHAFRCAPISFSGTESTAVAGSAEPECALDRAQREKKLQRALERLPNRLRSVVDMSCAEDMTLSQIGVRLGVSEARACQLRQQAVHQLRMSCADSFRPAARDWIASAA